MALLNTSQYYDDQYNNLEQDYADMFYNKKNTAQPQDNRMELPNRVDNNINTSFFSEPIMGDDNLNPIKNPYNSVVSNSALKNADASMKSNTDKINSGQTQVKATPGAGNNVGGKIASSAGAVASFGSDVYQGASSMANSDKEADGRTLKLAVSGAAMGATVGSVVPVIGTAIGAAAGFVIGGTAGMLMKVPDRKKRLKRDYGSYEGKIFDEINSRKATFEDYQKAQEIEQLKDLKKAQMGLIGNNY